MDNRNNIFNAAQQNIDGGSFNANAAPQTMSYGGFFNANTATPTMSYGGSSNFNTAPQTMSYGGFPNNNTMPSYPEQISPFQQPPQGTFSTLDMQKVVRQPMVPRDRAIQMIKNAQDEATKLRNENIQLRTSNETHSKEIQLLQELIVQAEKDIVAAKETASHNKWYYDLLRGKYDFRIDEHGRLAATILGTYELARSLDSDPKNQLQTLYDHHLGQDFNAHPQPPFGTVILHANACYFCRVTHDPVVPVEAPQLETATSIGPMHQRALDAARAAVQANAALIAIAGEQGAGANDNPIVIDEGNDTTATDGPAVDGPRGAAEVFVGSGGPTPPGDTEANFAVSAKRPAPQDTPLASDPSPKRRRTGNLPWMGPQSHVMRAAEGTLPAIGTQELIDEHQQQRSHDEIEIDRIRRRAEREAQENAGVQFDNSVIAPSQTPPKTTKGKATPKARKAAPTPKAPKATKPKPTPKPKKTSDGKTLAAKPKPQRQTKKQEKEQAQQEMGQQLHEELEQAEQEEEQDLYTAATPVPTAPISTPTPAAPAPYVYQGPPALNADGTQRVLHYDDDDDDEDSLFNYCDDEEGDQSQQQEDDITMADQHIDIESEEE